MRHPAIWSPEVLEAQFSPQFSPILPLSIHKKDIPTCHDLVITSVGLLSKRLPVTTGGILWELAGLPHHPAPWTHPGYRALAAVPIIVYTIPISLSSPIRCQIGAILVLKWCKTSKSGVRNYTKGQTSQSWQIRQKGYYGTEMGKAE